MYKNNFFKYLFNIHQKKNNDQKIIKFIILYNYINLNLCII